MLLDDICCFQCSHVETVKKMTCTCLSECNFFFKSGLLILRNPALTWAPKLPASFASGPSENGEIRN